MSSSATTKSFAERHSKQFQFCVSYQTANHKYKQSPQKTNQLTKKSIEVTTFFTRKKIQMSLKYFLNKNYLGSSLPKKPLGLLSFMSIHPMSKTCTKFSVQILLQTEMSE